MKTRTLRLSAKLLGDFLQMPKMGLTAEGFPADGRIVGVAWEHDRVIALAVESATFADEDPEFFTVTYHRG